MLGPQYSDEAPTRVPDRTLRQFAGLCVVIFGGLFGLSYWRHDGHPTVGAWIALFAALLVGLPGLALPGYIRPIYLGSMTVTQPIGHVVGFVLLGVIYFGLFTPLALLFRATGRDAMGLRRQPAATTYWRPRAVTTDVKRYLRQYQNQVADAATRPTGA